MLPLTIFEDQDLRALSQELELVSDQDDALVLEGPKDCLVKDAVGHSRIDSRQWVIQKIDVCVLVNSAGEADPCLLPARDVDTSLSNDGLPSIREIRQISDQLGGCHGPIEPFSINLEAKADVVLDRGRIDEWLLLHVGDFALDLVATFLPYGFLHDRVQQRRLA